MKTKTINAIICKKFDDFLSSISDDNVRSLVEKNTIITGGCIASMLLKEKVNDYDLYFTNKETVKAVAAYYVAAFKTSTKPKHGNGQEILIEVREDNDRIKIYIKSVGIAGEGKDDNYEYFESQPQESADEYVEEIVQSISDTDVPYVEPDGDKYRPLFLSANAVTLSHQIQIVIRFYGESTEIHDNYDFVHCTNYWTSKDRKVTLKQPALEALLSKELVYIGSKYPLCSIIRTRKFINRGWSINAGQYLKMIFQVSKLDLTDLNVLEDQLIGVDVAYFGQLIDGLKSHSEKQKEEGKEFKLDYGYLATIIDKIF